MKSAIFIVFIVIAFSGLTFAQKENWTWITGTNYNNYIPNTGILKMQFNEENGWLIEPLNDSLGHFKFEIEGTSAAMSDRHGNLLFYTNGFEIRDRNNDIIPNGDSLMPTAQPFPGSYTLFSQSTIILPIPGTEEEYIVISTPLGQAFSSQYRWASDRIYYHWIKTGPNGLYVMHKNQTILEGDTIQNGRIQAVRHANGRDWWLKFGKLEFFNHEEMGWNAYQITGMYIYLLSPQGLEPWAFHEFEEPLKAAHRGQNCYDQSGSLFISVGNTGFGSNANQLAIMGFDRCIGLLVPYLTDSTLENSSAGGIMAAGCIVAHENRYLYAYSYYGPVYQYDLESSDIIQSRVEIGNILPYNPPLNQNAARGGVLGPDRKIYIRTLGSSEYFHVIHNPDEAGVAAGFEENSLELPLRVMPPAPNFANFCLGALEGSPCDTLGRPYDYCATEVSTQEPEKIESRAGELVMVPNPAGTTVQVHAPEPGRLYVYDLSGRRVLDHGKAAEGINTMSIASLPAGIYITVLYGESGHLYRGRLGVVE